MRKLLTVLLILVIACTAVFAREGERPKVAIVLGGGGAKGIAHIALLEKIEELGIPVDKVYGTSMGALIGGLYSAGYTPGELEALVKNNDLEKLFTSFLTTSYNEVLDPFNFNTNNLFSFTLGKGIGSTNGLIDDYKILNFFYKYAGNVPDNLDFEKDLTIPFNCNAVDMLTGAEVVFSSGSLITAMRASMSIPIIFEPLMTDTDVYMDGGLTANLPVHLAVQDGYDIIIAETVGNLRELTPEDYESFTGMLNGFTTIIVKKGILGEPEKATLYIPVNTKENTTLGFDKTDDILACGRESVAMYEFELKAIADRFEDSEKVFPDPDRTGKYFSYPHIDRGEEFKSSKESRKEDLFSRTRISGGLYGGTSFTFVLKENKEMEEQSRFTTIPTVSLRAFIKDIGGSKVSLDTRLRGTVNKDLALSGLAMLRLTPDYGERLYLLGGLGVKLGAFSYLTDKTASDGSLNITEYVFEGNTGLKLTNEEDHIFNLIANAKMYAGYPSLMKMESFMRTWTFLPSFELNGVWYPSYNTSFFTKGMRLDFIGNIGWSKSKSYDWDFNYKLKAAYEINFELNEKDEIWFDATAVTHRGPECMSEFYDEYGGAEGIPGYGYSSLFQDYACVGVGYQRLLKDGFTKLYLITQLRGGVREEHGFYDAVYKYDLDYTPFASMVDEPHWDLGYGIGLGLDSPIGGVVAGIGFNLDKKVSLYVDIK